MTGLKIEQVSQRKFVAKIDGEVYRGNRYNNAKKLRKIIQRWAFDNNIYVNIYFDDLVDNYFIVSLNSDVQSFAFKMRWM